MKKNVYIFTDGSCLKNPGPGGYGIILKYKKYKKKISSGFYITTNNRMELTAAIVGLEKLKKTCFVTIYSDSIYLKKGMTIWIKRWKKEKWKKKNKKQVKNIDLWKKLHKLSLKHKIKWKWIKGHNGNTENEKCDKLAKKSARNPTQKDKIYEKIHYYSKIKKNETAQNKNFKK